LKGMKESQKLRRMAAHHVVVDGQDMGRCVVVCRPDGTVLDFHPLTREEPFTEWLVGTITVVDGKVQ